MSRVLAVRVMEKYLQHYAEPVVGAIEQLPAGPAWENVLVIPACNEKPRFLRTPPPCAGRSLTVLVINETIGAEPGVTANNQLLADAVRTGFERTWQSPQAQGLSLWRDTSAHRDLLLVDRFSEGRKFAAGGGVGLARKTGADIALGLVRRQRIRSRWIHCSDADVRLPHTYFTCVSGQASERTKYAALVYPYRHVGGAGTDGAVTAATQRYELALRYYVAGLSFAGSPYAFHTIGSTMAVDAGAYAKVRGFPRRDAGEDFYLLNKLAKVGSVLTLDEGMNCAAIEIAARRSDRVPFGTGAVVDRIAAMNDPDREYRYYHPGIFELLGVWLQSLPGIWRSGAVFSLSGQKRQTVEPRRALFSALEAMNADKALAHAFRQSRDLQQFLRQMSTWFDAFRTLKLIHALRDTCLPSVSRAELTTSAVFRTLLARDPELKGCFQRLAAASG